jgi:hypothetical protein
MSQVNVNAEFREFGEKMNVIMICIVLNFVIPGIPTIVQFIFTITSLKNIKKINDQLHNRNLENFRSKYITSMVIMLITSIGMLIAMLPFLINIINYAFSLIYTTPDPYMVLNTLFPMLFWILIIAAIGLVIIMIASIFQMKAWENLNVFFMENAGMFPGKIAEDAIEGTKNLRTASLCMALIFLLVTGIIGIIYQILGYSKLAKLKDLDKYTAGPPGQLPATEEKTLRYCASCGSRVDPEKNFCQSCGERIDY